MCAIRYCDEDEWYPVLSLRVEGPRPYDDRPAAEFSEDEIARIEKAFAEFDWAQALLHERFPRGED